LRRIEDLLPEPLRRIWKREYGGVKDYDVLHFIFGAYTGLIILINQLYGLTMIALFTLYQILDYEVTKDRPNRDVVTFTAGYTMTSFISLIIKLIFR